MRALLNGCGVVFASLSGAGMGLVVGFFEAVGGDVGVDLGGEVTIVV